MDDMYNEGQNHYRSQGKLVLSSHPDGSVSPHPLNGETSFMPAGSDQTAFMPAGTPPFAPNGSGYLQGPGGSSYLQGPGGNGYPQEPPKKGLFQKLRTDPAYQVLAVAIVVVLIASGSLMAFAATGMMGTGSNHNSPNRPQAKAPSSFTHATQVPTPAPTPTLMPTPVPTQAPTQVVQPTQAPNPIGGKVTVAFTNLPGQVNNNTTTQIVVQTNTPGASVQFAVQYAGGTGTPVFMTQTADNNGMATFNWTATVFNVFNNNTNVTARLTVTATDNNNGRTAQQTADVTVVVNNNNNGGGGGGR